MTVKNGILTKVEKEMSDALLEMINFYLVIICGSFTELPHVVGAQLYRLYTVDAHTDVLKPIHGKII